MLFSEKDAIIGRFTEIFTAKTIRLQRPSGQ